MRLCFYRHHSYTLKVTILKCVVEGFVLYTRGPATIHRTPGRVTSPEETLTRPAVTPSARSPRQPPASFLSVEPPTLPTHAVDPYSPRTSTPGFVHVEACFQGYPRCAVGWYFIPS